MQASSSPNKVIDQSNILTTITEFRFERVLSQDLSQPSVYLLGTLSTVPTIIHLEKTNFDPSLFLPDHLTTSFNAPTAPLSSESTSQSNTPKLSDYGSKIFAPPFGHDRSDKGVRGKLGVGKASFIEQNDVYSWAMGWFGGERSADVKANIISPCTEAHIRKYTTQPRCTFTETPQIYTSHILPYILSLPPSRIEWVYNILEGKKEKESVVFEEKGKEAGFLIIPDSKWDRVNLKTLYLQAIVQDRSIRSMRDLEPKHIPLLLNIKEAAEKVCTNTYGMQPNTTRIFVHYHPSYYHFHVHIVALENESNSGTRIGKAHLLDDIISLLQLSQHVSPGQSLIYQMTYTYVLGEQEPLYAMLKSAGLIGLSRQAPPPHLTSWAKSSLQDFDMHIVDENPSQAETAMPTGQTSAWSKMPYTAMEDQIDGKKVDHWDLPNYLPQANKSNSTSAMTGRYDSGVGAQHATAWSKTPFPAVDPASPWAKTDYASIEADTFTSNAYLNTGEILAGRATNLPRPPPPPGGSIPNDVPSTSATSYQTVTDQTEHHDASSSPVWTAPPGLSYSRVDRIGHSLFMEGNL